MRLETLASQGMIIHIQRKTSVTAGQRNCSVLVGGRGFEGAKPRHHTFFLKAFRSWDNG
jgi:hypothetical protein